MKIPSVKISDYLYELPESKIPDKPLSERDSSKLLVYNQGNISSDIFKNLADRLPKQSALIFNDTKVFPARLVFIKGTGALIEIFCLASRSPLVASEAVWECMVGNLKRWKSEILTLRSGTLTLTAELQQKNGDTCNVRFRWDTKDTFFEVLEQLAELPLPPYMNRRADSEDKMRYQTIYASHEGSVAAPTAGLHFTEEVMTKLKEKNIATQRLTLHVGAGTFKPVKAEYIADHQMHEEQFSVSEALIRYLLENQMIIAVGTTTMRVLESLYWLGCKLEKEEKSAIFIDQWNGYEDHKDYISVKSSMLAILRYMQTQNLTTIAGSTRIIIVPGYTFRICKGLITNFHQPQSTLILLVAAFLSKDWTKVYEYALSNDFRFLSYGDSSLLIP